VQHNLRAVRAMLLREWFDDFWHYRSVDWAGAFLDEWCVQVMRSQIEPMKKVARMLAAPKSTTHADGATASGSSARSRRTLTTRLGASERSPARHDLQGRDCDHNLLKTDRPAAAASLPVLTTRRRQLVRHKAGST